MDMVRILSVARGDTPADLVLRNAQILNVFSSQIEHGDIAVIEGRIAGIGRGYHGIEETDLHGAYVAPGLIDAHVHIESSLCVPSEFASAVSPRGVTSVITDPHEIANVCGAAGVAYMIEASRNLPIDVRIMAPSCVPATHLASAGASLNADELCALKTAHPAIHGLAEVMNFPGVIHCDADMLQKLARFGGCPIDGHCPGVRGKALNAYAAAGIGSDHESVTAEEAMEKLSRGLYVLIREATNARNLHALLTIITPETNRRICFCTDDRVPADLLTAGGIDHMVREAIAFGIMPVDAFRLATLNTAEYFGLADRGAIAPGRLADLMVFDDLRHPVATRVYRAGKLVAQDGRSLVPSVRIVRPVTISGSCNIDFDRVCFKIPATSTTVRVIRSLEGQLITESLELQMPSEDGLLVADPSRDIQKMAVIERHRGTGNVGLGFIQGFGLQRGAIAGTVAHDHHNLVVIGCDDISMMTAARNAAKMGGGLCVAAGETVLAELALPVAGLMSDQPIEQVRAEYDALLRCAADLGATMADSFMAMSFMALEVIPALKLTDLGLVDVTTFELVSLYVT